MTAINTSERVRFVGASEIATLMGINKFQTREHLVSFKAGIAESEDISKKPAVVWGHRLEDTVLHYVNVDFPAYTASEKCTEHWPHKEVPGLASSPDAVGTWTGSQSRGVVEAKTTGSAFWLPKDGTIPPGWNLQVQTQLSCSDGYLRTDENGETEPRFEWGALACLAQGTQYRLWHVERDDELIEQIHMEVGLFWREVNALREEQGLDPVVPGAPRDSVEYGGPDDLARVTRAECVPDAQTA